MPNPPLTPRDAAVGDAGSTGQVGDGGDGTVAPAVEVPIDPVVTIAPPIVVIAPPIDPVVMKAPPMVYPPPKSVHKAPPPSLQPQRDAAAAMPHPKGQQGQVGGDGDEAAVPKLPPVCLSAEPKLPPVGVSAVPKSLPIGLADVAAPTSVGDPFRVMTEDHWKGYTAGTASKERDEEAARKATRANWNYNCRPCHHFLMISCGLSDANANADYCKHHPCWKAHSLQDMRDAWIDYGVWDAQAYPEPRWQPSLRDCSAEGGRAFQYAGTLPPRLRQSESWRVPILRKQHEAAQKIWEDEAAIAKRDAKNNSDGVIDVTERHRQRGVRYELPYTVHSYRPAQSKGEKYLVDIDEPGEFIIDRDRAAGSDRAPRDDEWLYMDVADTPGLRIWYHRALSRCCAVQGR